MPICPACAAWRRLRCSSAACPRPESWRSASTPSAGGPPCWPGADEFALKDAGYDALQAAINGIAAGLVTADANDDLAGLVTAGANDPIADNDKREQAASQNDATRRRERVVL